MKKSSYQRMVDKHGIEWVREYYRNKMLQRRKEKGEELREYRRQWHAEHSDELAEKKRARRKNRTPEELEAQRAYDKKRREENPEKMKAWRDAWRIRNRDHVNEYQNKNRERDRARMREYARANRPKAVARHKQRCKEDPVYHIVARLRARMGVAVRRAAARKSAKSIELLGCTEAELVSHLESTFKDGMTWDNRDKWHVDHVRPIASFSMDDPVQQKAAFSCLNLQALWIDENLSKGAKLAP